MDMFRTKTAKLGALVFAAGIVAGVQPDLVSQYTDMKAADLVMLGLGLVFGRDALQKLVTK